MDSYLHGLKLWNLQGGRLDVPHSDVWAMPRKGTESQKEVTELRKKPQKRIVPASSDSGHNTMDKAITQLREVEKQTQDRNQKRRMDKAITQLRQVEKETSERNAVRLDVPKSSNLHTRTPWLKANGYTVLSHAQWEKRVHSYPKVKELEKIAENTPNYPNTDQYRKATAYGRRKIKKARDDIMMKLNSERVNAERELIEQGYVKTRVLI